jgi:glutamyl-Q tRNA(Asp) synthetase
LGNAEYRGRFAPSPTGPLHFGSLVTAVASYLDARTHGGKWLVRMEDVDEPRCIPGSDLDILKTLERFGLAWDGPVMYQSRRKEAYREAFEKLRRDGYLYPCTCSRREAGPVYPGTCRRGPAEPGRPLSWRVLTENIGDFVVLRSDGYFAYQLAVVVDDAQQGITDVVRGADLLDATPRQLWLQKLLGCPHPRYKHVPVVTNEAGEKLSKQTLAPPLLPENTAGDLARALRFLQLNPPVQQAAL